MHSCLHAAGAACRRHSRRRTTHLPATALLFPALQITSCGLTAQSVKKTVTSISVTGQGAQLAHVPPAVCQFTSLTSLNLSNNSITFLPQAVQDLQGLQQLLLARNDLGSLPPEIGALTALTELDVGANSIRKLPDALCKLTGLQVCPHTASAAGRGDGCCCCCNARRHTRAACSASQLRAAVNSLQPCLDTAASKPSPVSTCPPVAVAGALLHGRRCSTPGATS